MTHVTCRLTARNRDQLRNPTLGSGVWAAFTSFTRVLQADDAGDTGDSVGGEEEPAAAAATRAVVAGETERPGDHPGVDDDPPRRRRRGRGRSWEDAAADDSANEILRAAYRLELDEHSRTAASS